MNALKNIIELIRIDWSKIEGLGNMRRGGKKRSKRDKGIGKRRR